VDYKFTPGGQSYEAYAAGGVFYAAPGHTAFPVRLAVEIFRRCQAYRTAAGAGGSAVLYDPCCGSAYHLSTLPWFAWEEIERIYASDFDADALAIAARNLSLLTPEGLNRRVAELSALYDQFGKPSHAASLQHALALRSRLEALSSEHPIAAHWFSADATIPRAVEKGLAGAKADIVVADIPYGQLSDWQPATGALTMGNPPVHSLLAALLPVLAPNAVVAVAAGKQDKITHEGYRRLDRLSAGKRQIAILRPQ
jgi:hypothetical protein